MTRRDRKPALARPPGVSVHDDRHGPRGFRQVGLTRRADLPQGSDLREEAQALPFSLSTDRSEGTSLHPLKMRSIFRGLDFHDLGLFVLLEGVDRLRVLVGQLLDALLGAALVVAADL